LLIKDVWGTHINLGGTHIILGGTVSFGMEQAHLLFYQVLMVFERAVNVIRTFELLD